MCWIAANALSIFSQLEKKRKAEDELEEENRNHKMMRESVVSEPWGAMEMIKNTTLYE